MLSEEQTGRIPEAVAQGFEARNGFREERVACPSQRGREQTAQDAIAPPYLDTQVFMIDQNTPCRVYRPISENIHGFGERVNLSALQSVTGALAPFIAEWCGLEPVQ